MVELKRIIQKRVITLLVGVFFFVFLPIFPKNDNKNRVFAENQWVEMSAYTTYFNQKEWGRCENIRIAARLLDGITVQAYGEFSFNRAVGERTKAAGFHSAKIIVNGEYVDGVGGGVCQVSSTLYNAVLKAGLSVTEVHPHSLAVGYIPPSRDAMVSSHSDFCFFNAYAFPVRLIFHVFSGGIEVTIMGQKMEDCYELVSTVLQEIPPPPPIVKQGEEDGVLRAEKSGVKSELYIERYRKGKLISRKRLRVDEYRPIQGIIVKKNDNPTN
jgi:vancomycin resistance protein YoaR